MADRYVNYDKLLEERHRLGLDEMSMVHKVNAFNQFIDHLPTADVVEVVRCKECDYRQTHICAITGIKTLFCDYWDKPYAVEEEHYCGYGKRTPKERGGEK